MQFVSTCFGRVGIPNAILINGLVVCLLSNTTKDSPVLSASTP